MKKYVLCATLDEHSIDTLKNVGRVIDLKDAQIHIVTIVEIKTYNLDYIPFIYPTEQQYTAIEGAADFLLQSLGASLGVSEKNITVNCFFDSNREHKIKKYLVEEEADLVITATRGKHGIEGLFSSSFADFLCKFSPCDVLVMRPSEQTK